MYNKEKLKELNNEELIKIINRLNIKNGISYYIEQLIINNDNKYLTIFYRNKLIQFILKNKK